MEEKTIITGKISNTTRNLILYVGVFVFVLSILTYFMNINGCRVHHSWPVDITYTFWENMFWMDGDGSGIIEPIIIDLGIVLIIYGAIYSRSLNKVSITVSNLRVYGSAMWGKRVDLPIDSISAVATSSFKGIAVATSSGKIVFKAIENNAEIHQTISRLLMERQGKPKTDTVVKQEMPVSNADELKKYKDLLDSGIITQEEFDAKKKQLLGL